MPGVGERMTVSCPDCGQAFETDQAEGQAVCARCGSRFLLELVMTDQEVRPARPPSPGELTERLDEVEKVALGEIDHELLGQTIGNCQIEKVLGRGGMGVVFKATHKTLHTPVAVKILPATFAESNETAVRRFLREARASAKLRNDNIVAIFDAGIERGIHYIVMEYVNGPSLQAVLEEREVLPPAEAVEIICQVCDALVCAHDAGIIHRDIKPANIMIDEGGVVKLADLGLAKNVDDASALTLSGAVVGTPLYMAPEQISAGRETERRSDIYSLGCMLYRMVTGDVPYDGDTAYAILEKHVYEQVPDASVANPRVPKELADVIRKMMSKGPGGRQGSAWQVREEMQAALATGAPPGGAAPAGIPGAGAAGRAVGARAPEGPVRHVPAALRATTTRTPAASRPGGRLVGVMLAAAFVAVVVAAIYALRQRQYAALADWLETSRVASDEAAGIDERVRTLEAYLERYPSGVGSEEARFQLRQLERLRETAEAPEAGPAPAPEEVVDQTGRIAAAIDGAEAAYDAGLAVKAAGILDSIRGVELSEHQRRSVEGLRSRIRVRRERIERHRSWLAEHRKLLAGPGLTGAQRSRLLAEEYRRGCELIGSYPNDAYVRAVELPLLVRARPDGCTVFAGGREAGTAPVVVRYRQGAKLTLAVRKPGFGPKERVVEFHDSSEIEIQLLKKAAWTADMGANVHGAPALAGGKLVVACQDGRVAALDAKTGRKLWACLPGNRARFESDVAAFGSSVYIGATDGRIFALDAASGRHLRRWRPERVGAVAGGLCVQPVALFGKRPLVFAGCTDGRVYCLDARTGRRYWASDPGAAILTRPLVTPRAVYVGDETGSIRSFNVATGKPAGEYPGRGQARGSPVQMGKWICAGVGSTLSCFREAGSPPQPGTWCFEAEGELRSAPVASGGAVYFGTAAGKLYAVGVSEQARLWSHDAGSAVNGAPGLSDSRVYFGCADSSVYALDRRSGELAWRYEASFEIRAGLACSGGMLYVACTNGEVTAIADE